jgi:membrane associated rhomboid family serine protease
VYMLVPLGFILTSMAWPAWMMLGYWLLIQFVSGLVQQEGGGVAFWAHFGGFVAGVIFIKLFARTDYVAAHQARQWRPRRLGLGSPGGF